MIPAVESHLTALTAQSKVPDFSTSWFAPGTRYASFERGQVPVDVAEYCYAHITSARVLHSRRMASTVTSSVFGQPALNAA